MNSNPLLIAFLAACTLHVAGLAMFPARSTLSSSWQSGMAGTDFEIVAPGAPQSKKGDSAGDDVSQRDGERKSPQEASFTRKEQSLEHSGRAAAQEEPLILPTETPHRQEERKSPAQPALSQASSLKSSSSRSAPSQASSALVPNGATSPVQVAGLITPEYPALARRKGFEGRVVFSIAVSSAGAVEDVTLVKSSGFEVLDRAARLAVEKAEFSAALQAGLPIRAEKRLAFNFSLDRAGGKR